MPAEKLTQLPQLPLPPQPTDQLYIVRPSEGFAGSHSILYGSLFAGVGRALPPLTTPVSSTAGGAADPLQVYSIPAGTLPNDGDYLRFTMAGIIGPINGEKGIQPQIIAGSTVEVTTPFPVNNGFLSAGIPQDDINEIGATGWRICGEIVRTAPNALIFSASLHYGWLGLHSDNNISAENQGALQWNGVFVGPTRNSIPLNGAFSIRAVCFSPNAGDLTQYLTTVEVFNF